MKDKHNHSRDEHHGMGGSYVNQPDGTRTLVERTESEGKDEAEAEAADPKPAKGKKANETVASADSH